MIGASCVCMMLFSYHFAGWNHSGGKQNGSKSWFLTHGKKGNFESEVNKHDERKAVGMGPD